MSQMQPPIPNPDDWARLWPSMPPPADPKTPSFPYKGADGKLYEDERDARATFDVPPGRPAGWMLSYSMFEPPHYLFVGPMQDEQDPP